MTEGTVLTLATDPRADPRMVAALEPFGLHLPQEAPPVTGSSPIADIHEFAHGAEAGFQAVFAALSEGVAPVGGVSRETRTITGEDGNEITLYIHKPDHADGPLPCVVHFHGGGMAILEAVDALYQHLRDEYAATGLVVVGVEFRNSSGKLGNHPYPAGLDDCAAAARWAAANLDELGASHLVISGESGGGNLTLATALKAKREGWIEEVAGVYAQCPYVSDAYEDFPEDLPSLRENDDYFVSCHMLGLLAATYDPENEHSDDPTCWPLRASREDLEGLPPHVISVNEMDPLRDEGLAYYRALCHAGVSAVGRVVTGTCHGGDLLLPTALPDVHAASVRDVSGFAHSLV